MQLVAIRAGSTNGRVKNGQNFYKLDLLINKVKNNY
jgi:hypothetical protein